MAAFTGFILNGTIVECCDDYDYYGDCAKIKNYKDGKYVIQLVNGHNKGDLIEVERFKFKIKHPNIKRPKDSFIKTQKILSLEVNYGKKFFDMNGYFLNYYTEKTIKNKYYTKICAYNIPE